MPFGVSLSHAYQVIDAVVRLLEDDVDQFATLDLEQLPAGAIDGALSGVWMLARQ